MSGIRYDNDRAQLFHTPYGRYTATYPRLDACRVRVTGFRKAAWWRRGLDRVSVFAFVARVAGELELRDRDLAAARAENDRLKAALRDWQTRVAAR